MVFHQSRVSKSVVIHVITGVETREDIVFLLPPRSADCGYGICLTTRPGWLTHSGHLTHEVATCQPWFRRISWKVHHRASPPT